MTGRFFPRSTAQVGKLRNGEVQLRGDAAVPDVVDLGDEARREVRRASDLVERGPGSETRENHRSTDGLAAFEGDPDRAPVLDEGPGNAGAGANRAAAGPE